jgi:hypothetical protein
VKQSESTSICSLNRGAQACGAVHQRIALSLENPELELCAVGMGILDFDAMDHQFVSHWRGANVIMSA